MEERRGEHKYGKAVAEKNLYRERVSIQIQFVQLKYSRTSVTYPLGNEVYMYVTLKST